MQTIISNAENTYSYVYRIDKILNFFNLQLYCFVLTMPILKNITKKSSLHHFFVIVPQTEFNFGFKFTDYLFTVA